MSQSPLSWYVRLVVAAGGAILVHSVLGLAHTPYLWEWFLFATLAILIGSFTIPIASVYASISVADTFFITSALLFGPGPAAVTLALDMLVSSWRKKHGRMRTTFNVVAPAASLWTAAHLFFLLARIPPLSIAPAPIAPLILPLLCLTTIYFVMNSALIAVAVGLESRLSPLRIWREHFLWLSLGYFAAASVALCLTLIIQQVGLGAVAVVLPVVVVFHLTLRASFGRLEDADLHVKQVDRLYTSTVETLAMAIDAKDDVTHNHVRRVQTYALALARAIGISDETELKAIEAAALLHDTGKLAVPEHILNKPGGLTAGEFEQMKRHVDIGADILSLVEFPYPVVPIVRCHHENWDGSGYPNGVAGTDIPIGARILSVVDCYDALMSDRPYRRRLTDDAAIGILMERRGRMYDPEVVDMFVKIHLHVGVAADSSSSLHVFEQIKRSHLAEPAAAVAEPAAAPVVGVTPGDNVLAFVSLARLASGPVALSDVLALSTNLIGHIVPNASGAWFTLKDTGDRLIVAEAFGASSLLLRGLNIGVSERLTGWVAAHRKVIVNSDAALDLGDAAGRASPPLRSCLSVPLCAGQKLIGVLSLYAEQRDAFTADQGRLLEMIAPHLAQAMDAATALAAPQAQTSRELRLVRPLIATGS